MSEVVQKQTVKSFTMNVLNGLALGTVIVLIPGAILGELMKALLPLWGGFATLILCNSCCYKHDGTCYWNVGWNEF